MTELERFNEDLKRLYRNMERVKTVDYFIIYGSLNLTFQQYTAAYFVLANNLEDSRENAKIIRERMAEEVNGTLVMLRKQHEELADLEIEDV